MGESSAQGLLQRGPSLRWTRAAKWERGLAGAGGGAVEGVSRSHTTSCLRTHMRSGIMPEGVESVGM